MNILKKWDETKKKKEKIKSVINDAIKIYKITLEINQNQNYNSFLPICFE